MSTASTINLPESSCPTGYTRHDLRNIGIDLVDFEKWMNGKTFAICEGKYFNYKTKQYEDSPCSKNPHGDIFYHDDVKLYIRIRNSRKK